jgi:hypothetical protein
MDFKLILEAARSGFNLVHWYKQMKRLLAEKDFH